MGSGSGERNQQLQLRPRPSARSVGGTWLRGLAVASGPALWKELVVSRGGSQDRPTIRCSRLTLLWSGPAATIPDPAPAVGAGPWGGSGVEVLCHTGESPTAGRRRAPNPSPARRDRPGPSATGATHTPRHRTTRAMRPARFEPRGPGCSARATQPALPHPSHATALCHPISQDVAPAGGAPAVLPRVGPAARPHRGAPCLAWSAVLRCPGARRSCHEATKRYRLRRAPQQRPQGAREPATRPRAGCRANDERFAGAPDPTDTDRSSPERRPSGLSVGAGMPHDRRRGPADPIEQLV